MFAKDLHNERAKRKESCITSSELKLAEELIKITEKFI